MPIMNIQSSGVNLPSEKPRKPSTLENVALALGIAKDVIGTGLDVYKTREGSKTAELEREKTIAETEYIKRKPVSTVSALETQRKSEPPDEITLSLVDRITKGTEFEGYKPATQGRAESFFENLAQSGLKPMTEYQRKTIRLKEKELAGAGTGSKELVKADIEDYTEQRKKLPEMYDRIDRINDSLRLINKVPTGPIVGSRPSVALRKWALAAKGDDGLRNLQQLELNLNKEGLEIVAAFAQRAGARSIDSDKERAYVQSTAPGLDKHPEVLRTILLTTKAMLKQGSEEVDAKRKWLESHDNFKEYVSPLSTKKTYYNPQTMEVDFFEPGKHPNGWLSLADRIADDPQGNSGLTWEEQQRKQELLKKQGE